MSKQEKLSYNQLTEILERISDGFVALDKNWCYKYMSKKAGEIVNRDPEEMIGKNMWEEFPALNQEPLELHDAYMTAMNEQKSIAIETCYKPFDKWFETHIYPSADGLAVYFKDITEKKKANSQLLIERGLSDSLINSLPGVFYFYNKEGKFLSWNKNFETVTGYSNKEISNMHPLDFFDVDEKQLLEQKIKNVFLKGEDSVETKFMSKSGEKTPYYFTGKAFEYNGEICLMGVGIDISKRTIIEKELQHSEENYRKLFEQASDGIIVADGSLQIAEVNRIICNMLGYSREELLRKKVFDVAIISSEDSPIRFEELKAGDSIIQERNFKRNDGVLIPVEVSSSMMQNGNYLAFIRDISERKKAEHKLQESENRLRTILENEPECVKILNQKGEIIEMNPAGLAMIEAESLELVKGKPVLNIVNESYRKAFTELTRNIFQGKPGKLEFEITGLKGSSSWLETHAVPLRDTAGTIISLLGVTRDITKRKKAENEILTLNRELEQRVKERTTELMTANTELEEINNLFVGRESRIIELKEEVEKLKKQNTVVN